MTGYYYQFTLTDPDHKKDTTTYTELYNRINDLVTEVNTYKQALKECRMTNRECLDLNRSLHDTLFHERQDCEARAMQLLNIQ